VLGSTNHGATASGRTELRASTAHGYAESEIAFMQQVARQVAVAVDNALNFERAQAYQRQLAQERDRLRVLLEVNNAMVSKLDLRSLLNAISASLRRVIHHEYTSLALYEEDKNRMRMLALDFPQGKGLIHEEMLVPLEVPSPAALFEADGRLSWTTRPWKDSTRLRRG